MAGSKNGDDHLGDWGWETGQWKAWNVLLCGVEGLRWEGRGLVALLHFRHLQRLRQGSLTCDGPEAAMVRPVHPSPPQSSPETVMEGCAQGPLTFLCGFGGLSVPQGLSPPATTGACVQGSGCSQGTGPPGPRSGFPSLTRSLTPRTGQLTCDLGVEGSQAVSVWSGWTRRGQGPGRGHGWRVRVPRDYVHSRCILVILVPVCPGGQIRPLPGHGHTKQLFVPRDLCPLP